jgi:FSR family fosmidomycin resistance protein-like MFS transporter
MAKQRDEAFRSGPVAVIAAGHFVHDVFTSFLAPLLPRLVPKLGMSLAEAGGLSVFQQLPALANPWVGAVADRVSLRWLAVLAPTVTAAAMASIGLAPTYAVLAVLMVFSGVSNAVWHVLAPVAVAGASGRRLGRGMSFFMLGGELARSVGPLIAVAAVFLWGLDGIWRTVPLGIVASLLLHVRLPREPRARRVAAGPGRRSSRPRLTRVFVPIAGIIAARAFLYASLATYLPTLLAGEGASLWFASGALSIFQLSGAVGVLASGTLSDRFGRRCVLVSLALAAPLVMHLFLAVHGGWILPVLVVQGMLLVATNPVLLALVQDHAGDRRATANGIYMTLGFVLRSAIVVAVGAIADVWGLRQAFHVSALVGFLGVPFALCVPRARPGGGAADESGSEPESLEEG